MMRFATYNIWNADIGMPDRANDIIQAVKAIKADVLCLQEVLSQTFHDRLVKELGYTHHIFCAYKNEQEGLSIFSRFPMQNAEMLSHCLIVKINVGNITLAFANVHLPWDSILKRETESILLHQKLSDCLCDFRFIAGDFNSSEHSSVQQFFLGESSLHGYEAHPCWFDLAEGFACQKQTTPEATLNFYRNPRWKQESTVEINKRMDRILLQNPYPTPFPQLIDVGIFGTEVSVKTGLSPSDHYGVYVDLTLIR